MRFDVRVRKSAKSDIRDSVRWYDQQRPGLGKEFLEEVKLVFKGLEQNPRRHQVIKGTVRREVMRRFPFCVYYIVEQQVVEIIGVFHAKRDPAIWQARIP